MHATRSPSAQLRDELRSLPERVRERLVSHGFDEEQFLRLAEPLLGDGATAAERMRERNVLRGDVQAPRPDELARLPTARAERAALEVIGQQALERGELAFCVLAGGMATRMGSVIKALVPAVEPSSPTAATDADGFDPKAYSFLDARITEQALRLARTPSVCVPLWLMTSEATDDAIGRAIAHRVANGDWPRVPTGVNDWIHRCSSVPLVVDRFRQNLSLRLTPAGHLFRGSDCAPSLYGTGHGDVIDGLLRSGLLAAFVRSGGKYVWIANVDNLGATVDEAILGYFIQAGNPVLVEVVDKAPGDRGGIPVHAEGRLQVVEEFRLPPGFDPASVSVFNTNTFLVDARRVLDQRISWKWFEVHKTVDGRPAVQFERLLQELTTTFPAGYLRVSRSGADSRFLPVKDYAELERRRDAIREVLVARQLLRAE
jgi:UTP--glucose-1-phosphate uridylyltransferase